jgi:hypothetical protein
MPKPKKPIDTGKPRQVDAYTHDEYDRANIPPMGMAQYECEIMVFITKARKR